MPIKAFRDQEVVDMLDGRNNSMFSRGNRYKSLGETESILLPSSIWPLSRGQAKPLSHLNQLFICFNFNSNIAGKDVSKNLKNKTRQKNLC